MLINSKFNKNRNSSYGRDKQDNINKMNNEDKKKEIVSASGSYCIKESEKDHVVIMTKEDLKTPPPAYILKLLDKNDDEEPGKRFIFDDLNIIELKCLILFLGITLPNGQINWNCPCLGGMASGPCAWPFREAFSCFHYSTAEIKGIDCITEFDKLQECMKKYPKLYNDKNKKSINEFEKDD